MPVNEKSEIVDLLQELVKLDYDAIEAYEAAIERVEASHIQDQLAKYCDDHRRHTRNLGDHLRRLGGDVPEGPDFKRVLTKGKVVIADLGGDKAILTAMKVNEDLTNKSYEKAVEHSETSPELKSVLEGNLADEREHRAWIKRTIEAL